ncbi:MAG: methionine adenosyltransferase domain-containing protein, partial [Alphaproteobacteria bacterium]
SVFVDCGGTAAVDEVKLANVVSEVMDLSPKGIRTKLQLNKPIYQRTAAYGHFGRTPDADGGFSWEKLDLVEAIKAAL